MEKTDITIIGAGIIGLAISYELSLRSKYKNILVIEQHPSFGQETSSRNSEVIHAGLYYPKDSLKTNLCLRGNRLLYALCEQHQIPYKKLGKLVIAPTQNDTKKIEDIYHNALHCDVKHLQLLDKNQIRTLEPRISCVMGFLSPETGIIDSHALMKFFYEASKSKQVEFAFGVKAIGIEKKSSGYTLTVQEPNGDHFSFETKTVINAAGLHADKIAEFAGINIDTYHYRLHFNKGQYFRLAHPQKFNITSLIYPPPSATSLGIHITPDLAGGLRLGPDDQWVDTINYTVNEKDKKKFFNDVRRYLPELTLNDLISDTSGIRPKLQKPDESFHDFVIAHEIDKGLENFINLIGIESPGLTSCLAIAEKIEGFLS